MALSLDVRRKVPAALRTLLEREFDQSLRRLDQAAGDKPADRGEGVHEYRRSVKRLRAALQLASGVVPAAELHRIDRALSDAARRLGTLRDAHARRIAAERVAMLLPKVWRALAMQEKPEDNIINREEDDIVFQMGQVEDAIDTAVIRIRAMLKSAFEDATREFLSVPEMSELINGDDVEAALAMTEGEDGAVTLIREKLGGFDWTRPMHRKVRRWVIERSAGRVAAPEPKKVEKTTAAAPTAKGGNGLNVPYKGKVNGAKPDVNCVTLLQVSASTPEELFLVASAVQYTDRAAETLATVLNEALAAVGSTNFFNASDEGDKKKLAVVFVKARDVAINWAKERVSKT